MQKVAQLLKGFVAAVVALTPALAFAQAAPSVSYASGSITTVIGNIVNYVATIAGAIAVLMIVWGGIQYMVFGADQGKKTITNGLTGLAIIILAFVLVKLVISLVLGG